MSQQKNNSNNDHIILEYMAQMTKHLSQTFKDLQQLTQNTLRLVKSKQLHINGNNPVISNGKHNNKNKKPEDINDNLVDSDEEINGIPVHQKFNKKSRSKRIEQAQEDIQQQIQQKPAPVIVKKQPIPQQKIQKPKKPVSKPVPIQTQQKNSSRKVIKPISHKPKAPTSSFLLFFKQQQHSIAKSYPNYGVVQLTKVAAKCWNELSVSEKEPYQKLFEQQRKKYQQQMQKYRRQFPQQVKQKEQQKKERKKIKAKQRRQKDKQQPSVPAVPKPLNIPPPPPTVPLEQKMEQEQQSVQDYGQKMIKLQDEQNSLGEDI